MRTQIKGDIPYSQTGRFCTVHIVVVLPNYSRDSTQSHPRAQQGIGKEKKKKKKADSKNILNKQEWMPMEITRKIFAIHTFDTNTLNTENVQKTQPKKTSKGHKWPGHMLRIC